MALCSGIKADGGRCKAQATRDSEYCINHDPEQAEARKRRASKGGKRGGRGRPVAELAALRAENASLRERLIAGELDSKVVAVAVQSLSMDIRALDVNIRARQAEEFEQRLEELEAESAVAKRTTPHGHFVR